MGLGRELVVNANKFEIHIYTNDFSFKQPEVKVI